MNDDEIPEQAKPLIEAYGKLMELKRTLIWTSDRWPHIHNKVKSLEEEIERTVLIYKDDPDYEA